MSTVNTAQPAEQSIRAASQRIRIAKNLDAAIAAMRAACDDAERRSKDGDAYAVQMVLHSLAWGMANATTSIECAMAATQERLDQLEIAARTTGARDE